MLQAMRVETQHSLTWWLRWPQWSSYAAAAWSFGYGLLGIYWALGGGAFPFGREGDPEAEYSVLASAAAESFAPIVAAVGLAGFIVAILMARSTGRGVGRLAILISAWTMAATLLLVMADTRLLMMVTRIFIVPVFIFTGIPGGGSVAEFYPWPRLNLIVVVVGGILWALAVLGYQRRTAGNCPNCGRSTMDADDTADRWIAPERWERWGRWAVAVAMIVPVIYGIHRMSWVTWVPQSFRAEDPTILLGGVFMGLLALGGAALTLGLALRWGEVFPRWIPFAGGKRVPPLLAILPASIISIFVISAGVADVRKHLGGGVDADAFVFSWPGLLWPLWGAALAIATYAYYRRRCTYCRVCGGGSPSTRP